MLASTLPATTETVFIMYRQTIDKPMQCGNVTHTCINGSNVGRKRQGLVSGCAKSRHLIEIVFL